MGEKKLGRRLIVFGLVVMLLASVTLLLIRNPHIGVYFSGLCQARTPLEYQELMSDEFQPGSALKVHADGPSALDFLKRIPALRPEKSFDRPTLGTCLCRDSLVLYRPGPSGVYHLEAFSSKDNKLQWAIRAVDFAAYCGKETLAGEKEKKQ